MKEDLRNKGQAQVQAQRELAQGGKQPSEEERLNFLRANALLLQCKIFDITERHFAPGRRLGALVNEKYESHICDRRCGKELAELSQMTAELAFRVQEIAVEEQKAAALARRPVTVAEAIREAHYQDLKKSVESSSQRESERIEQLRMDAGLKLAEYERPLHQFNKDEVEAKAIAAHNPMLKTSIETTSSTSIAAEQRRMIGEAAIEADLERRNQERREKAAKESNLFADCEKLRKEQRLINDSFESEIADLIQAAAAKEAKTTVIKDQDTDHCNIAPRSWAAMNEALNWSRHECDRLREERNYFKRIAERNPVPVPIVPASVHIDRFSAERILAAAKVWDLAKALVDAINDECMGTSARGRAKEDIVAATLGMMENILDRKNWLSTELAGATEPGIKDHVEKA